MMYGQRNARLRFFLDANILFSASDARSKTSEFLAELLRFDYETVTSSYAWAETRRNIISKCPHWLNGFEELRDHVAILDVVTVPLDVECAEKDKPILAGAVGARCTHLWTGDKAHFGKFYGRTIHGVMVISSLQLVSILRM